MTKKQKTFKWYFIITILIAVFKVIYTIIARNDIRQIVPWAASMAIISSIWLIVSLIMFVKFKQNELPKRYFLLPSYFFIILSISTIFFSGMAFGAFSTLISKIQVLNAMIGFVTITSLFEFIDSIYVLMKK